jgi:hypothetical protein
MRKQLKTVKLQMLKLKKAENPSEACMQEMKGNDKLELSCAKLSSSWGYAMQALPS